MKVVISKKVTEDLVNKFSEILGYDTEVIYMERCTPMEAEAKSIDIVLAGKNSVDKTWMYGVCYKRPANVTNDQITAMVIALGVSDGRWASLEGVWRGYVEEVRKTVKGKL